MTELIGIARFTFHEGRVEDFKRLSAQCMDIVRDQDTGTLQYDIYLDADETAAVVIERYRDLAALDEHLAHIGEDLMTQVAATGTVVGEVLGDLDAERRAQMDGGPVRALALWASR